MTTGGAKDLDDTHAGFSSRANSSFSQAEALADPLTPNLPKYCDNVDSTHDNYWMAILPDVLMGGLATKAVVTSTPNCRCNNREMRGAVSFTPTPRVSDGL